MVPYGASGLARATPTFGGSGGISGEYVFWRFSNELGTFRSELLEYPERKLNYSAEDIRPRKIFRKKRHFTSSPAKAEGATRNRGYDCREQFSKAGVTTPELLANLVCSFFCALSLYGVLPSCHFISNRVCVILPLFVCFIFVRVSDGR